MGNQQTAQLKSRALSSNKILLVAKGIYAIDVPEITNKQMLLALKEGAPKLIKLQIHLRDQGMCFCSLNLSKYVFWCYYCRCCLLVWCSIDELIILVLWKFTVKNCDDVMMILMWLYCCVLVNVDDNVGDLCLIWWYGMCLIIWLD